MSLKKELDHSFKKVRLVERLVAYHEMKADLDKLIEQVGLELIKLDKENAEKGDHNVSKGTKA